MERVNILTWDDSEIASAGGMLGKVCETMQSNAEQCIGGLPLTTAAA